MHIAWYFSRLTGYFSKLSSILTNQVSGCVKTIYAAADNHHSKKGAKTTVDEQFDQLSRLGAQGMCRLKSIWMVPYTC